jgi:hypothetical protein
MENDTEFYLAGGLCNEGMCNRLDIIPCGAVTQPAFHSCRCQRLLALIILIRYTYYLSDTGPQSVYATKLSSSEFTSA